jgi:CHAT domain-containing protein
VGTLWKVNDLRVVQFVTELHRQFTLLRQPAEALSSAKRRLLEHAPRRIDAVRAWAPFELAVSI